jgi:hypothetical protein
VRDPSRDPCCEPYVTDGTRGWTVVVELERGGLVQSLAESGRECDVCV